MHSGKKISLFYLALFCTRFFKPSSSNLLSNPFISVELRMDLLLKKTLTQNFSRKLFSTRLPRYIFKANLFFALFFFLCFLFWEKKKIKLLESVMGKILLERGNDVPTLFCQKRYVFLLFFGRTYCRVSAPSV